MLSPMVLLSWLLTLGLHCPLNLLWKNDWFSCANILELAAKGTFLLALLPASALRSYLSQQGVQDSIAD
jgi:hypothetical protein